MRKLFAGIASAAVLLTLTLTANAAPSKPCHGRKCPSPSPTPTTSSVSPSPTPSSTPTVTSSSVTPTPTTSTTTYPTTPPNTQGTWVSPEGVTIIVDSAGNWTISQIYALLKDNALQLDIVGKTLTVDVQDQFSSQTQTSSVYYVGKYSIPESTMWLQGVGSNFATSPDSTMAHEYGHAWSNYWYYVHQATWGGYLTARWTTADGSLTLATDSRVNSSYSWNVREIFADDYRLLFGTQLAISERNGHLNQTIPDPRNVPGLRDFMLGWGK